MKSKKMQNGLVHALITILILSLCTLISRIFIDMNVRTENTIMIYLVGVLFIIIETKKLLWGIASSFISIITFNYFFTQPLYSLHISDPNYIITILIFLIVSIVTGVLMGKMQQHAATSHYNEQQTLALYEISKSYLNLSGLDSIFMHNIHSLYHYQNIISVLYYYDIKQQKLTVFMDKKMRCDERPNEDLAQWCYDNSCSCGYGTMVHKDTLWTYHPLHHGCELLGVYALYHSFDLSHENTLFANTLISQMVLAIEREQLYETQEVNRIEIEKEKLRNNLLRSISHDLRTPLTGIAGSSSLIMEKHDDLDVDTQLNLIRSINSDAQWLTTLVENLLNMTRIQDGRLLITKQKEVVDDIICEALGRCETRKGAHTICAHLPETVQLVSMDGKLIVQVLVNYLDNALKHTQDDSIIDIWFRERADTFAFEVCDNGSGIDEQIADHLFDSFVTTKNERADSKRGVGLGLSICKAIIEAHHGTVYAHNQKQSGAVFGFTLPKEEETEHE